MALNVNGVGIENVTFNGTTLDKITFNGVTVWERIVHDIVGLIPKMTSRFTPYGNVGRGNHTTDRDAWMAFDGDTSTSWLSANTTTIENSWIRYSFRQEVCIDHITYLPILNGNYSNSYESTIWFHFYDSNGIEIGMASHTVSPDDIETEFTLKLSSVVKSVREVKVTFTNRLIDGVSSPDPYYCCCAEMQVYGYIEEDDTYQPLIPYMMALNELNYTGNADRGIQHPVGTYTADAAANATASSAVYSVSNAFGSNYREDTNAEYSWWGGAETSATTAGNQWISYTFPTDVAIKYAIIVPSHHLIAGEDISDINWNEATLYLDLMDSSGTVIDTLTAYMASNWNSLALRAESDDIVEGVRSIQLRFSNNLYQYYDASDEKTHYRVACNALQVYGYYQDFTPTPADSSTTLTLLADQSINPRMVADEYCYNTVGTSGSYLIRGAATTPYIGLSVPTLTSRKYRCVVFGKRTKPATIFDEYASWCDEMQPIDVTNYNTITFTVINRNSSCAYAFCGLRSTYPEATNASIGDSTASPWEYSVKITSTSTAKEFTIDISEATGEYYIGFFTSASTDTDLSDASLRLSKIVLS